MSTSVNVITTGPSVEEVIHNSSVIRRLNCTVYEVPITPVDERADDIVDRIS